MMEDNFNELLVSIKKDISSIKLSEQDKKVLLSDINNIENEFNRFSKCYKMNNTVLEQEKKLLLDNFIKKDSDANYLYNKLSKIENSRSWKLYQKFKSVKNKIIK